MSGSLFRRIRPFVGRDNWSADKWRRHLLSQASISAREGRHQRDVPRRVVPRSIRWIDRRDQEVDHDLKRRSRRLLLTTKTELNAMAAPAMSGLSRPSAASGSAATL